MSGESKTIAELAGEWQEAHREYEVAEDAMRDAEEKADAAAVREKAIRKQLLTMAQERPGDVDLRHAPNYLRDRYAEVKTPEEARELLQAIDRELADSDQMNPFTLAAITAMRRLITTWADPEGERILELRAAINNPNQDRFTFDGLPAVG